MIITITLNKDHILNEVAKTTAYVGDKMVGQEDAYERISTTEENTEILNRFYEESISDFIQIIKNYYYARVDRNEITTVSLDMPNNFEAGLVADMNKAVPSFCTNFVLSRWFIITNKEEATIYIQEAERIKTELTKKLYARKRPMPVHVAPDTPVSPDSPTYSSIIVQKI